jgi:CCR4-NOT transcription complex subunit 1
MNDHHNKQREHWNGRVYFRLFSTLLCELHDHRDRLAPEQEWDMHKAFATALLILQPRYFSGFMYPWLALLSHRLFVPAFLSGPNAQKRGGGWTIFTKLLTALFLNLGDLLSMPDSPPVAQDFYRGVLRFFTMLHHDFPDYLIQNHMTLNASVPLQCLQLQNIVNSAVTRAVFNDQPDPFTPGLKINRLEQVRQHPLCQSDYVEVMQEANFMAEVERIAGNSGDDEDFDTVLAHVDPQDGRVDGLVVNALVVYIGIQQTNVASVFSSASGGARLLERLLRVCSPKARYHLVSAMANQIRYVNSMTHYYSTAMQHWFSTGAQEVQEQIMRVLCERLMVPRPHPWGLIVMMLEMVKNETNNIWSLPWIKTAPQVESMLLNLAHSQDQRQARSPMGAMM